MWLQVFITYNERNKRLFDKTKRDANTIMEMIVGYVKLKLMSMKVKEYVQIRKLGITLGPE